MSHQGFPLDLKNLGKHALKIIQVHRPTSGNNVQSILRLRELLEAQGAMRASRPYREVTVSARAR